MNLTTFLTTHPVDKKGYSARIPTKSGKLYLSIIAGESFYSTPRKSGLEPDEYTEFEVAIFNVETDNWASYNEVEPIFEIFNSHGEYPDEKPEKPNEPYNAVFGWIKKEAIEKAWEIL